jgi:hypothetical protein
MVSRVQLSHRIHCDVDVFWRDFVDDAVNQEVFVGQMGYPSFRVLERKVDGALVWQRIEITPKVHLPDAVARIVGDKLSFVEVGEYDGDAYRFSYAPPAGFRADLATVEGLIRAERTADGETERSVEISCEVRMFGFGGLLESAAIKTARDAYDTHAVALNAVLAKRMA